MLSDAETEVENSQNESECEDPPLPELGPFYSMVSPDPIPWACVIEGSASPLPPGTRVPKQLPPSAGETGKSILIFRPKSLVSSCMKVSRWIGDDRRRQLRYEMRYRNSSFSNVAHGAEGKRPPRPSADN